MTATCTDLEAPAGSVIRQPRPTARQPARHQLWNLGGVAAGADGSVDQIRDHEVPWGIHRQGGFIDPFGHLWLVGDRSPLGAYDLR